MIAPGRVVIETQVCQLVNLLLAFHYFWSFLNLAVLLEGNAIIQISTGQGLFKPVTQQARLTALEIPRSQHRKTSQSSPHSDTRFHATPRCPQNWEFPFGRFRWVDFHLTNMAGKWAKMTSSAPSSGASLRPENKTDKKWEGAQYSIYLLMIVTYCYKYKKNFSDGTQCCHELENVEACNFWRPQPLLRCLKSAVWNKTTTVHSKQKYNRFRQRNPKLTSNKCSALCLIHTHPYRYVTLIFLHTELEVAKLCTRSMHHELWVQTPVTWLGWGCLMQSFNKTFTLSGGGDARIF